MAQHQSLLGNPAAANPKGAERTNQTKISLTADTINKLEKALQSAEKKINERTEQIVQMQNDLGDTATILHERINEVCENKETLLHIEENTAILPDRSLKIHKKEREAKHHMQRKDSCMPPWLTIAFHLLFSPIVVPILLIEDTVKSIKVAAHNNKKNTGNDTQINTPLLHSQKNHSHWEKDFNKCFPFKLYNYCDTIKNPTHKKHHKKTEPRALDSFVSPDKHNDKYGSFSASPSRLMPKQKIESSSSPSSSTNTPPTKTNPYFF